MGVCVCLNMSFHYLEQEIFLENQVNSWKKKLHLGIGRWNCYSCFFIQNVIYTTQYFFGVLVSVVFDCSFCLQNKRNKRQSAKKMQENMRIIPS